MSMLYVMQHGGNFVERATSAKDIVYLVCSVKRIILSKCVYYFSDGHGTDNFTTFYDGSRIDALPAILDWTAIKADYWGGQDNLNIKRKKQAEFLVSDDIPFQCIIGFLCYNEKAKQSLLGMGIEEKMIKVAPGAYY